MRLWAVVVSVQEWDQQGKSGDGLHVDPTREELLRFPVTVLVDPFRPVP